jgi:hypothetical protein
MPHQQRRLFARARPQSQHSPTPSGFAEAVSDYFLVFDAMLCATAALRRAITEMGTSAPKIC